MALENYRDIGSYGSNSPGFQFEFHCSNCAKVWKTPFKPYRKGQVAGFFASLLMHFHGVRNVGYATRLASDAGLGEPERAGHQAVDAPPAAGLSCPNCRSAHGGGRFCAECGFDLASTHKSCPDCGAMATRQARYCNDCGHGF
jgi:membrane protease subunit (stomatin/prohibitin family)